MDITLNMPDPTKVALVAWALAHAQAQPHDDLSAAIREQFPARGGWPDRTIRELAQWINEWQQAPHGNAGYWCSAACKSHWARDYGDAVRAHRAAHLGISLAEAVQVLAQAQPGSGTACLSCGDPLTPAGGSPPVYLLGVTDPDGDRGQLEAYLGGGAHFEGLPLGTYQIIATPPRTLAWLQGRLASGLRGGGTAFPTLAAALTDLLDLATGRVWPAGE